MDRLSGTGDRPTRPELSKKNLKKIIIDFR